MKKQIDEEKLDYILSSLNQLEFGNVAITVHDGDITQVDINEKKRFPVKKSVGVQK